MSSTTTTTQQVVKLEKQAEQEITELARENGKSLLLGLVVPWLTPSCTASFCSRHYGFQLALQYVYLPLPVMP